MGRAAVRTVARRARQGDTGQRDFAPTGSVVCGDSPRCNRNPNAKETPSPRPEGFFIGHTVGFTDKHLNERASASASSRN